MILLPNHAKFKTEVFTMATRGRIHFNIQDAPEKELEQVMTIGLFSDAYPSGEGMKIYNELAKAVVNQDENIERAFVRAFGNWESDCLMDDNYIYHVTLKSYLATKDSYSLLEITHFKVVRNRYDGEVIFDGEHEEFRKFCDEY